MGSEAYPDDRSEGSKVRPTRVEYLKAAPQQADPLEHDYPAAVISCRIGTAEPS